MTDFDNTNKGVLFRETDKESDKHPDMTGKINVDGKEYRLAGWTRESKNGKRFLSLSISEFKESNNQSGYEKAKAVAQSLKQDDDEPINLADIPF